MGISLKIFVASITFLGCWFLHESSVSRASKPSGQGFLFGRAGSLGILACGVVDLAMSAAMWCRELGTVVGLAAWGFVSLASWTLLVLIVGRARPRGRQWKRVLSHPSPGTSEADGPGPAERITAPGSTHVVAILLFVAAILAFFKQWIETWNVE